MKYSRFSIRALSTFAIALAVVSCSDRLQPTEAAADRADTQPLFAQGKPDTYSRANLVFANDVNIDGVVQPAGIRGDGRLRNGSPAAGSPSEYQGSFCGVFARLEGGPLRFDPDAAYSSTMQAPCGPPRFYNFYLDGPSAAPTTATPMSISREIELLAPGESHSIFEGFGPVGPCGNVQFNDEYPPSNNVLVTRLADVQSQNANGATVTARQWRIASQGSHRAACLTFRRNGTPQYSGVTYYLPFAITVTEVPYPYPSYP